MNKLDVQKCICKAREQARQLRNELNNDDDIVGADDKFDYISDGIVYNVSLTAFWESSSHFDISISCDTSNFKYYEGCLSF